MKTKIFKESMGAWLFMILLASIAARIPATSPHSSLITAALLLYIPLFIYSRKKEKVTYIENSGSDLKTGIVWFAILSLAIFPFVFLGNHLYQSFLSRSFQPDPMGWTSFKFLFFQILMVGLPEEFFFRGYLLDRFNEICGKRWNLFGVSFGPALFYNSLLFALSHSIIAIQWWHIFIFFPAVAFGWLREKTGFLTASILFHAVCNLFSHWAFKNYL